MSGEQDMSAARCVPNFPDYDNQVGVLGIGPRLETGSAELRIEPRVTRTLLTKGDKGCHNHLRLLGFSSFRRRGGLYIDSTPLLRTILLFFVLLFFVLLFFVLLLFVPLLFRLLFSRPLFFRPIPFVESSGCNTGVCGVRRTRTSWPVPNNLSAVADICEVAYVRKSGPNIQVLTDLAEPPPRQSRFARSQRRLSCANVDKGLPRAFNMDKVSRICKKMEAYVDRSYLA